MTSTVFISRLQGLPILDGRGDKLGTVRDVVIQKRISKDPLVRGLVVELFAKRQVFLPIIRVRSITDSAVSIGGQIDTRKFERRSSEILVIEDLFDRIVKRPAQEGKYDTALVYDVAMTEVRAKDWAITEVALREIYPKKRLGVTTRAYGPVITRPWKNVDQYIWTDEQTVDNKIAQLTEMKPADIARELHDMDPERRKAVVDALNNELLADAFQELPNDEQVEFLTQLDSERAADVLEEMDPDDAADLLHDLPEQTAEDLLARMQPEEAEDVRYLMQYEELTAGGMMTPEPVILAPDATVSQALAKLRNEELTPALASMVFITRSPQETPTGRYLGAVHIQRLLREPPSLLASKMIDDIEPVSPDTDLYQLSRYFATYNLVIAPVVNEHHQLVGAVTVDDLLDHMLPTDWRGEQMDGEDEHNENEVTDE